MTYLKKIQSAALLLLFMGYNATVMAFWKSLYPDMSGFQRETRRGLGETQRGPGKLPMILPSPVEGTSYPNEVPDFNTAALQEAETKRLNAEVQARVKASQKQSQDFARWANKNPVNWVLSDLAALQKRARSQIRENGLLPYLAQEGRFQYGEMKQSAQDLQEFVAGYTDAIKSEAAKAIRAGNATVQEVAESIADQIRGGYNTLQQSGKESATYIRGYLAGLEAKTSKAVSSIADQLRQLTKGRGAGTNPGVEETEQLPDMPYGATKEVGIFAPGEQLG